ncbi:Exosome complex component RRP4 [Halotydeus destructor]|nr:Exosome complex component RRP4 [Halotydeus destructor]
MEVDAQQAQFTVMDSKTSLYSTQIRLKDGHDSNLEAKRKGRRKFYLPGDTITDESGFMRGHGTYAIENAKLVSSVAGVLEPINKLISVRPQKTRYSGEIGDVLIGRIVEVQIQQKRWKVDVNGRLYSALLLSSVNLPSGELRRKTEEDERTMRSFFVEGDLISAEVQNDFNDGSLSLHTRSLKYGKLGQGLLVKVSPSLIERRKTHFHNLSCGAHIIIGNNGYIWICPIVPEGADSGGFVVNKELISLSERQVIVRLRNCIMALAKHKIMIHDTTIIHCYSASESYQLTELLNPEIIAAVIDETRRRVDLGIYG